MTEAAQAADAVLMIRPRAFGWNPETAASNAYQPRGAGASPAADPHRFALRHELC